jgi:hypothetical protein
MSENLVAIEAEWSKIADSLRVLVTRAADAGRAEAEADIDAIKWSMDIWPAEDGDGLEVHVYSNDWDSPSGDGTLVKVNLSKLIRGSVLQDDIAFAKLLEATLWSALIALREETERMMEAVPTPA